ncbi:MAG TPA: hypothetical protein ENH82_09070 [bacterium]|nr:hypothetical protein [bacterium]
MIYDCFTFYDEYMLLEIRLNELSPFVDKFVLVESDHSFSGKEKPLYYDEVKDNEVFGPFRHKIIHVVFHMTPKPSRWGNEYEQRNAIGAGLSEAKVDDIIIVSDADEIVSPKAIAFMKQASVPGRVQMKDYYYYFNCLSNVNMCAPAFCRYRDYRTAQFLRIGGEGGGYHKTIIHNGGWHFGYLMPVDKIALKLEAFAHAEFDTDFYKDADRIQKCLDTNTDLFNRTGLNYSIEPLDAPKYVMNNIDRFKEFIKTPETALG